MLRAALLFLLTCLCVVPALAAEVAEVVGLRGEATVIQGGRSAALTVGLAIEAGALIETGAPGRVKLKFIDGSVVIVGDQSTFRVDHMSVDAEGERESAGFVLDVGLISQRVAPARKGKWAVRTPTAVTAVRGTEYIVEVLGNRSTAVDIQSGEVSVEPIQRPEGLRQIGGVPLPPQQPVLLDRGRLGTHCDPETYVCTPAAPTSASRLKAIRSRLSGV